MTKEERKEIAVAHTNEQAEKYAYEIEHSIKNSKIYRGKFDVETLETKQNFDILVVDKTTTDAALMFKNGTGTAVLNFASYHSPGGGFIRGSIAQEEALCHDSNLYNILKEFQSEYDKNKGDMNDGLYRDFAIYSPNVWFKDSTAIDVITCPAPNRKRFEEVSDDEEKYIKSLYSRIRYVLDVAQDNNVETLVLGAFGCGVFGNDPGLVASAFDSMLKMSNYSFKTVIFAVPSGNYNYEVFSAFPFQ